MSTLHPTPTSVNSRLADLERAGWVETANSGYRQTVAVTDAGRAVLAANPAA